MRPSLVLSKNLVLLILTISSMLLISGCQSATYQRQVPDPIYMFYVPAKVTSPTKPKMEKISATRGMEDPGEFKKIQRNITKLVTYANGLRDTVNHYERVIDSMQQLYDQTLKNNPNANVTRQEVKADK